MRYFKWFELQSIFVSRPFSNYPPPCNIPYLTSAQCDYLMSVWGRKHFTFDYCIMDDLDVITIHEGEHGRDDRVLI